MCIVSEYQLNLTSRLVLILGLIPLVSDYQLTLEVGTYLSRLDHHLFRGWYLFSLGTICREHPHSEVDSYLYVYVLAIALATLGSSRMAS